MQKFGTLTTFEPNGHSESYLLVWYETDNFSRIDLFNDDVEYNMLNTSNCEASYYKTQRRELIYGNDDLIRRLLLCKTEALTATGSSENTIDVVNGNIVTTQQRINNLTGRASIVKMVNGMFSTEYYKTQGCIIDITEIDLKFTTVVTPINLPSYKAQGFLDISEIQSYGVEYHSEEYLRMNYDIAHIDNNDFVVVEDDIELARTRLNEWVLSTEKIKAIDIETTGTETWMNGQDVITGLSLSYNETNSTYFCFRQENTGNLPMSFLQEIVDAVNNQPEDVVIIAYNGKFEIEGFMKEDKHYLTQSEFAVNFKYGDEGFVGLKRNLLRIDRDPYFLSVFLNPVMKRGLHGLKDWIVRITGKVYLELNQIFKKNIRFNVLPAGIIKLYACPDSPNSITVYKYLLNLLPKDQMFIYKLECKLMYVKAYNEFYGLGVDTDRLVKLLNNEQYKVDTLSKHFKSIHHITSNINSYDVIKDIIYNRLRCPIDVRTNTGQPSTSSFAIDHIVDTGMLSKPATDNYPSDIVDMNGDVVISGKELVSNKYPSLVIYQMYKKCMKELGALNRIQRKSIGTMYRFGINSCGAGSGRQTSDAHQMSTGMKSLIIADSSKHYFWSCDYKQIELRVLAYLAGDEKIIELANDKHMDMHRAFLSINKNKPVWDISKEERDDGKRRNFGIIYMMSEYGMARRDAGPRYTEQDIIKARNSISDFFNGLPKIKQFKERNIRTILDTGQIKTAFGWRRFFPEVFDPMTSPRKLQSCLRQGNNTPMQGFAATLMKMTEVNIFEYCLKKGWLKCIDCDGMWLPMVRPALSIHDEVLLSSHKSIPKEEIIKMFKECMEIEIEGAPAFYASPALSPCWLLGKDDKYEIPIPLRDKVLEEWEHGNVVIHDDTYLEDIDNYRKQELASFMSEMIAKYKTPEEVAANMVHPEFTHTLITIYVDMHNPDDKALSHRDRIKVAVERYMSGVAIDMSVVANDNNISSNEDDIVRNDEDFSLDQYVEVDDNGVIQVSEDEEIDADNSDDVLKVQNVVPMKRYYVFYGLQEVMIDLMDIGICDEAENINQEIGKLSGVDKPYRVVYMVKPDKNLVSNLYVDFIPDILNDIVSRFIGDATTKDVV